MGIFEKIEQVRNKPEHVRRLYVIVCVIVSMVFVLGIWFVTLKSSFNNSGKKLKDEERLQLLNGLDQMQDIKESMPTDYESYYYESVNTNIKNEPEQEEGLTTGNGDDNSDGSDLFDIGQ